MNEFEKFKETYFAECTELLDEAGGRLAQLDQGERDPANLHAVFRAVHSIKGGAGAFGFDHLVAFSHRFETLLDLMREGRLDASETTIATCIRGIDVLSDLVDAAHYGRDANSTSHQEVGSVIERLCRGCSAPVDPDVRIGFDSANATVSATRRWAVHFKPHRALFERANEPLLLLRELCSLGQARVMASIDPVPPLHDFDVLHPLIAWNITLDTAAYSDEIKAIFEFVDGDCDLLIEEVNLDGALRSAANEDGVSSASTNPSHSSVAPLGTDVGEVPVARTARTGAALPKEASTTSIRVDLEKVDRVVDMVGEIVITQAVLAQQIDERMRDSNPEIMRCVELLAQQTRVLQDSIMSMRAQPVRFVFARMARLIRELATQLGKKARLEMSGEATEIDKTVIEQLSDPLVHMIRNSLDHGIETPERRRALGKPEEAVIRLSAAQVGGRIVIRVADDGAGIDRERVRRKAIARGLLAADSNLHETDIDQLIFAPGFTTSDVVTDTSGRGVGMDVVRQNIEKLGGRVGVANEPGQGVVMTMILPLTLAVLDVMLVRSGGTPYVVPLASVIESMQAQGAATSDLPSGSRVLRVRQNYVRLFDLAAMFGASRVPNGDAPDGFIVLCETDGGRRAAIVVDEILGQQQVVIKSIEANFARVEGIAGGTILGDGSVALILDVAGLELMAERRSLTRMAA